MDTLLWVISRASFGIALLMSIGWLIWAIIDHAPAGLIIPMVIFIAAQIGYIKAVLEKEKE